MSTYNRTRYVENLLEKNKSNVPSFTVHLHREYWTLNNGSKFLYNNQIASLLDDIRAHRIPVDFLDLFDATRVPFYDGCMIVELLDYRPPKTKDEPLTTPNKTRVVLHPDSETLWADICLLNRKTGGKWSDRDALEVESKLLKATSGPLCLTPDPHLTRMVNQITRVSTPAVPASLKRKAAAMNTEDDEAEKVRRMKLMQYMNPRTNRTFNPTYRILDIKQRMANPKDPKPSASPAPQAIQSFMNTATRPPSIAPQPVSIPSSNPEVTPTGAQDTETKKQKSQRKTETPKIAPAPAPTQPTQPNGINQSHTSPPPQANQYAHLQHLQDQRKASGSPAPNHAQNIPNPNMYRGPTPTNATQRAPTPQQQHPYNQQIPIATSRSPVPQPQTHPQSASPQQNYLQPGSAAPNGRNKPAGQQTPQQPQSQAQMLYSHQIQATTAHLQQHSQLLLQQQRLQAAQSQANGRATPQNMPNGVRASPLMANQQVQNAGRTQTPQAQLAAAAQAAALHQLQQAPYAFQSYQQVRPVHTPQQQQPGGTVPATQTGTASPMPDGQQLHHQQQQQGHQVYAFPYAQFSVAQQQQQNGVGRAGAPANLNLRAGQQAAYYVPVGGRGTFPVMPNGQQMAGMPVNHQHAQQLAAAAAAATKTGNTAVPGR